MTTITSKLPSVGTTIFTTMSALAAEVGAINLSQGFPDYECSAELIELINKAMKDGHNQYAPMGGVMKLREQIAKKTERLYGAKYDPVSEITVIAGGTQAIFTAICTVVNPNDEVIIFEPAFDCYAPAIKLMGGIVKAMELQPPHYGIDWGMVRKLMSNRTKLIIINSPHNPTATILRQEDIEELSALVKDRDIYILSDEVYEHLIYDGETHHSMARYPDLAQRSFVVASFGKLLHTTGWKVGYCLAPAYLTHEFRKIHQYLVFSVNSAVQTGIADYLEDENVYLSLPAFFQQKRDHFVKGLSETRFELLPSHGSYFQLAKYEHISNESDIEFTLRLTKEAGVACIPTSVFYTQGTDHRVIRFCFAKKQETLDNAVNRLISFKL